MSKMEEITEERELEAFTNDLEATDVKQKFYESNAGDGTTVYDQYLQGVPLVMCLVACFICLFLIALDQTIVVTMLETIGSKFNAYDDIGWVASGYLLTMCIFAATWGKVSIVFGRKNSLLVAIAFFEAGSLICALAPNMNVIIGGRVLAGIGGGGIQTLTFIIGSEMVPINKRPLVFMCFGFTFAISSITGPLIGGALTENVTWRWCFYLNLPLGAVAVLALVLFFHPPKTKGTLKEEFMVLDYTGTFLLSAGTVLFLLALTFGDGTKFSWNSSAVISCFVLGGIITILFCLWNFKYSKAPVIPLEIVKVPQVDFPVIALFTTFFCFMAMCLYITTYFQVILGHGPLKSGIDLLPAVGGLIFGNISTALLINKTRHIKPFAVFGSFVGCIGFGVMTTLQVDSSASKRAGYLILPGYFLGALLQSGIIASQLAAPKTDGSTILTTSLFNFSRSLGGAIGGDLSQAVFNSSAKSKIKQVILQRPDLFPGSDFSQIGQLISSPRVLHQLPDDQKQLILEALMGSVRNVFYMVVGMTCLTFVLTLFYSNKRLPKEKDIQTKDEYEKRMRNDEREEIPDVHSGETHDN